MLSTHDKNLGRTFPTAWTSVFLLSPTPPMVSATALRRKYAATATKHVYRKAVCIAVSHLVVSTLTITCNPAWADHVASGRFTSPVASGARR